MIRRGNNTSIALSLVSLSHSCHSFGLLRLLHSSVDLLRYPSALSPYAASCPTVSPPPPASPAVISLSTSTHRYSPSPRLPAMVYITSDLFGGASTHNRGDTATSTYWTSTADSPHTAGLGKRKRLEGDEGPNSYESCPTSYRDAKLTFCTVAACIHNDYRPQVAVSPGCTPTTLPPSRTAAASPTQCSQHRPCFPPPNGDP